MLLEFSPTKSSISLHKVDETSQNTTQGHHYRDLREGETELFLVLLDEDQALSHVVVEEPHEAGPCLPAGLPWQL